MRRHTQQLQLRVTIADIAHLSAEIGDGLIVRVEQPAFGEQRMDEQLRIDPSAALRSCERGMRCACTFKASAYNARSLNLSTTVPFAIPDCKPRPLHRRASEASSPSERNQFFPEWKRGVLECSRAQLTDCLLKRANLSRANKKLEPLRCRAQNQCRITSG
jgi:hypothetical protein